VRAPLHGDARRAEAALDDGHILHAGRFQDRPAHPQRVPPPCPLSVRAPGRAPTQPPYQVDLVGVSKSEYVTNRCVSLCVGATARPLGCRRPSTWQRTARGCSRHARPQPRDTRRAARTRKGRAAQDAACARSPFGCTRSPPTALRVIPRLSALCRAPHPPVKRLYRTPRGRPRGCMSSARARARGTLTSFWGGTHLTRCGSRRQATTALWVSQCRHGP